MTAPRTVVETKHTLDGRAQRFSCLGLLMTPALAVIRFDHPAERRAGGFHIPSGSRTLGYFWRGRAYNCYRMTGPVGVVIAYRFDVVERVRISETAVSYRDLLLDVWLSPAGELTVEDEDEVADAAARGLLSPDQLERIARTRRLLEQQYRRIVAEVEVVASRL